MQLEVAKYFYDIQHAAHTLSEFMHGRAWADYERDAMLRAATELQFEIIGVFLTGAIVGAIVLAKTPKSIETRRDT